MCEAERSLTWVVGDRGALPRIRTRGLERTSCMADWRIGGRTRGESLGGDHQDSDFYVDVIFAGADRPVGIGRFARVFVSDTTRLVRDETNPDRPVLTAPTDSRATWANKVEAGSSCALGATSGDVTACDLPRLNVLRTGRRRRRCPQPGRAPFHAAGAVSAHVHLNTVSPATTRLRISSTTLRLPCRGRSRHLRPRVQAGARGRSRALSAPGATRSEGLRARRDRERGRRGAPG